MNKYLENNNIKAIQINNWLETLPELILRDKESLIKIIPTDASSREYFRIKLFNENSLIVMYSEIKDIENMIKFKNISLIFKSANIKTPIIYAENFTLGFFLLEDFGDDLYYNLVKNDKNKINNLYKDAIDNIIKIQLIPNKYSLKNFDYDLIIKELSYFKEWYLKVYLKYDCTYIENEEIKNIFDYIAKKIISLPYFCMHRDYHSRNLIQTIDKIGIIDIQDAILGPFTYDLSSLLYDAYIVLDEQNIVELLEYYYNIAKEKIPGLELIDFENFCFSIELTSLQRNLKISGLFVKLGFQNYKYKFLEELPVVINYIIKISNKYNIFKPLSIIIDKALDKSKNKYPCLLLAAGRGERLRPFTDVLPKPLLEIKNKSLIEYLILSLVKSNIINIVINLSWLGDLIKNKIGTGEKYNAQIEYSYEKKCLGICGGIKQSLHYLKPKNYFITINSDIYIENFDFSNLIKIINNLENNLFDNKKILGYMYLVSNPPHNEKGDFYIDNNIIKNSTIIDSKKFTFTGIAIYHYSLFSNLQISEEEIKLIPILNKAINQNLIYGELLDSDCSWYDVGHIETLNKLNNT